MMYQADEKRYETMQYNRCGKSGLLLPKVSLGLWHNFGSNGDYDNMKAMCFTAFDHGITHFDLANNYGPEPGSAEINFGRILKEDLGAYRDEMLISTKAGFDMWDGPYGNWGSKKISNSKSGSESEKNGIGVCRYLLSSPYGSGNSIRGNNGNTGADCPKRKSTVCWDF